MGNFCDLYKKELTYISLLFMLLASITYVATSNISAVDGKKYQRNIIEQKRLEEINLDLKDKLYDAISLKSVEKKAKAVGFTQNHKTEWLLK